MSNEIRFQGIGTRNESLVVYIVRDYGGTKRFEEVLVPFKSLVHDEVWYELHKASARALKERWESGAGDSPLDGL